MFAASLFLSFAGSALGGTAAPSRAPRLRDVRALARALGSAHLGGSSRACLFLVTERRFSVAGEEELGAKHKMVSLHYMPSTEIIFLVSFVVTLHVLG